MSAATTTSTAFASLKPALKTVDNVLSFAKSGPGKPNANERSLFAASVALSYAVWESYIEDLAVEAISFVATHIEPGDVPDDVRKFITESSSPWQLSVHPGWRGVWIERVKTIAKGDDQGGGFGLNTANKTNVRRLFSRGALDPFEGLAQDRVDALDNLVALRGAIVHTGQPPKDFVKQNAIDGRTLVEELAKHADSVVRRQAKAAAYLTPW